MGEGGSSVSLGDVSKAYKAGKFGKQIVDRRGWLSYLRREAIIRALKPPDSIVTDPVAEAANIFCDALDETPLYSETRRQASSRIAQWVRETITHGVRYPKYDGVWSDTFYRRLALWVREAADSPRGQRALDYAGFPKGNDRAALFAVAVANETQGLLAESRQPPGQNVARHQMASEVHRAVPRGAVIDRYNRAKLWVRAAVAGVAVGGTTELIFVDDWVKSLAVGVIVFSSTAVAEFASSTRTPSADKLAVRRQVGLWLDALPRKLRSLFEYCEEHARNRSTGDGREALLQSLSDLARGTAELRPLGRDSDVSKDLNDLISLAGEVGDRELRSYLIDVQAALRFQPSALPSAFARLMTAIESVPRDEDAVSRESTLSMQPGNPPLRALLP